MTDDQVINETPKILSGGVEATSGEDLLEAAMEIEAPEEIRVRFMALIGEQRRREQETTQRLKTILDSVLEGIMIVDATGMIQDFNKSAVEILRATGDELLGSSVDVMFIDRKTTLRHRLLNRCINISTGVLKYDYTETMAQRLDGDSFPMEIIVSPANFSSEMSYLYIFRDITRRKNAETSQKKLEEDLREALKLEAIGHLAGGIAHEINTPSQYIRDNLKFLNDSYGALSRVLGLALQTLWKNRNHLPQNTFEVFAKQMRDSDLEFMLEEIPHATQQSLDGINQVAPHCFVDERVFPSGRRRENNHRHQPRAVKRDRDFAQ
ncbi:PAS domain S-box protein [Thalassospira sp.]|uniref:PAS domain S-box protein n=1 Tax=Thalassospira sp. TaxID=1912094 RepID=UPI0032EFA2A4